MTLRQTWNTKPLKFAFWAVNGGLAAMVLLSMLPIGLLQTVASMEHGLWFARSAEFMQQNHLQVLRWLRMIGDTLFAAGIVSLGYFVAGLKFGWSIRPEDRGVAEPIPVPSEGPRMAMTHKTRD
jgi:nitric oxide reductase subunit B